MVGTLAAVTDLLSLQANVYESGLPLDSGNVSVYLYSAASGGTQLWHQNYSGIIVNGTYDILLGSNNTNNLSLDYGTVYYLDLKINQIDQNFSGNDRQQFQAGVGNITSLKIAPAAVNSTHISDGNITSAKIAAAAVNSTHLSDGNVTTSKIADGNITTSKLDSGAATVAKGGVGFTTYSEGDILYGNGSSTGLSKLTVSAFKVLVSNGTTPFWGVLNSTYIGNVDLKNITTVSGSTFNAGDIIYASAADTLTTLGRTSYRVLLTDATNTPAWGVLNSTYIGNVDLKNITTVSGSTFSAGDMIYASAGTVLSTIGITNNRVLISAGAPTWGLVNSTHISDGNITSAKIAPDLSLGWQNLSAYPSACSAGKFISALDDSPTCGTPSVSDGSVLSDLKNITAVAGSTFSAGDIIYASGGSALSTLSRTSYRVLITDATNTPAWGVLNSSYINNVDLKNITTVAGSSFSAGDVIYAGSSGELTTLGRTSYRILVTDSSNTPKWSRINTTYMDPSAETINTTHIINSTILKADLDTSIYDSAGLRMNDISTNDFSTSITLVIGAVDGTNCNSACSNQGLSCSTGYYVNGTTISSCGSGSDAKHCWCQ